MVEETNDNDSKDEQEPLENVQTTESNIYLNKPSSNAETKNVPKSQVIDRDMLITTAMHFLKNSKVKNVPLSQKRAFLLRKGLTNEDIDIAIERINSNNNEVQLNQSSISNNSNIVPYQQAGPVMMYQDRSIWYRWKEFGSSLMVIGATFYGFYYIFKKFIEPLIIGKKKEEEDRMSKIERHLTELNKSLTQLRHSLVCVESTLSKHQTKSLESDDQALLLSSDTIVQAQDIISLSDIKNDVASIKSLLLSRNQFPAAPISSLSIPTWQLKQEENKQNDEDANDGKKSDEELEAVPNGIGTLNGNVSDH